MHNESTEHAIHRLRDEIHCLTDEQTDAMETETFIGMTVEETEAYDARRTKILQLLNELRLLEQAA
jgi:hypothetical protein